MAHMRETQQSGNIGELIRVGMMQLHALPGDKNGCTAAHWAAYKAVWVPVAGPVRLVLDILLLWLRRLTDMSEVCCRKFNRVSMVSSSSHLNVP